VRILKVIGLRIGAQAPSPRPPAPGARRRHDNGASVFARNCLVSHPGRAAHATGPVGPNLDQLKPPPALVNRKVHTRRAALPAFGGRIYRAAQIDAGRQVVSRRRRK